MPNAYQNYIITQDNCNKYQPENCNFFPTTGTYASNNTIPYYNNNSELFCDNKVNQYVKSFSSDENIDKELFSSLNYSILPFIFCGFPRRKSQYKLRTLENNNKQHCLSIKTNKLNYINEYSFHFNTVKLQISCDENNLLYGIYPLRLINWIITQIKTKQLYKNAARLNDKYDFYADVLGSEHPSASDIAVINQAIKALANAQFNITTNKQTYENISVFTGDVSWLWADASQWQTAIPINDDFIELASKNACPISKKAQYNLYGSELILFNFFMYQNYCLNESNRKYTYHINQLADVLNLPNLGSTNIKNNKYKIIELCNRISNKSGLQLIYEANGIMVSPNVDALLVQPLKTIKSNTGKIIMNQKEINVFTKQHSDLDVARAMFCVQYRINNGMPVDNPRRYMWWFLREKDGKAAKSMFKAGLAIKDAQYKKYKTVPKSGDINSPSQYEMIAALDITRPDNKPKISNLSEWQQADAITNYQSITHQISTYKYDNNSDYLDAYLYRVWLIVTQQIIPTQLQADIDAMLQIPKIVALAKKYKKSIQQLAELEDLSNYLFGGSKNVTHA